MAPFFVCVNSIKNTESFGSIRSLPQGLQVQKISPEGEIFTSMIQSLPVRTSVGVLFAYRGYFFAGTL